MERTTMGLPCGCIIGVTLCPVARKLKATVDATYEEAVADGFSGATWERYLKASVDYTRHFEVPDWGDKTIVPRQMYNNSGEEHVFASNGMIWDSFEEARRRAADESAPTTCPHCGRAM